jgi:hypothetical protein
MRKIIFLAILSLAPIFAGCKSTTCDARGPNEYCELHHQMMEEVMMDRQNNPMPSQEYLKARVQGFRHSYPFLFPAKCDHCMFYVCPDCVRAEQEWVRRHPGSK